MEALLSAVGAAILAVVGCVGVVAWIAKRLVTSLTDEALKNMRANTQAVREVGDAVASMGQSVREEAIRREEHDKTMFRTLDRIERRLEGTR